MVGKICGIRNVIYIDLSWFIHDLFIIQRLYASSLAVFAPNHDHPWSPTNITKYHPPLSTLRSYDQVSPCRTKINIPGTDRQSLIDYYPILSTMISHAQTPWVIAAWSSFNHCSPFLLVVKPFIPLSITKHQALSFTVLTSKLDFRLLTFFRYHQTLLYIFKHLSIVNHDKPKLVYNQPCINHYFCHDYQLAIIQLNNEQPGCTMDLSWTNSPPSRNSKHPTRGPA